MVSGLWAPEELTDSTQGWSQLCPTVTYRSRDQQGILEFAPSLSAPLGNFLVATGDTQTILTGIKDSMATESFVIAGEARTHESVSDTRPPEQRVLLHCVTHSSSRGVSSYY